MSSFYWFCWPHPFSYGIPCFLFSCHFILQVGGEKMYDKARRGESIELSPRRISIYQFDTERSLEDRLVETYKFTSQSGAIFLCCYLKRIINYLYKVCLTVVVLLHCCITMCFFGPWISKELFSLQTRFVHCPAIHIVFQKNPACIRVTWAPTACHLSIRLHKYKSVTCHDLSIA